MTRKRNLPTVSSFDGIKVEIYYNDHAPPHVHVSKGDVQLVLNFLNPLVPPGMFSRSDKRTLLSWIEDNRDALLECWRRAGAGLDPGRIPPP